MSNQISATEVTDRKSFIKFLGSLRNEFENNTGTWENIYLSDFLEATMIMFILGLMQISLHGEHLQIY